MVENKSLLKLILGALLVSLLLAGCGKPASSENVSPQKSTSNSKENKVVKIGITQIAEHPALDGARDGFIAALESEGFTDGKNIEIEYQNAQGDNPTASTIANNFVSSKKDLILAIATPSAQAAYNATKDIPILITAVTDPVLSGLAESWEKPGKNVTGTSDAAPVEKQFELLKAFVPEAKNVGVIFNTSEANSEIQVEGVEKIAEKNGMKVITAGVTATNDIPQALASIRDKIDVLYVPTDNMVAAAMPIIAEQCIKSGIPVIGSERAHVDNGALATEGIDYYKLGFQTGLAAVEVINGKNPAEMEISVLKDTELVINETTAAKLGIEIPEDLRARAEIVK